MVYLAERNKAINTGAKFYDKESCNTYIVEQNKKLLEYLVKEIKDFVRIIHDSVIYFY